MKLKLESIDGASAADQLQVNQCVHLVHNMVAKIRWLSNELMPETLIHKGLLSAVIDYANLVNDDSELQIIFESSAIPALPPTRSVHIFRILQEIIHNTIKHSKAATLKIEFLTQNDQLVILTADDGRGFDYHSNLHMKKGLVLDSFMA